MQSARSPPGWAPRGSATWTCRSSKRSTTFDRRGSRIASSSTRRKDTSRVGTSSSTSSPGTRRDASFVGPRKPLKSPMDTLGARHVYDNGPVGRRNPFLGGRQSQREDETADRSRGRSPKDLDARVHHHERRILGDAPPRMGPSARRDRGSRRRNLGREETRAPPRRRPARPIERGASVPPTRPRTAEVRDRHADLKRPRAKLYGGPALRRRE